MSKVRLSFVSLLSLILLFGCSDKSAGTITDPDTKPDVETVQTITPDMMVIHYLGDQMDRGNHDFFDKDVVIDTKYYDRNEVKRGDIVFIKPPEFEHEKNPNLQPPDNVILRVVGLEGEKVKIDKGQVYINGKKLDTFYGSFHRRGMDLEQYLTWRKESNQDKGKDQKQVRDEWYRTNTFEEVTVPEGHVYALGDDWFRSFDSRAFGPLTKENIIGKVLGYK